MRHKGSELTAKFMALNPVDHVSSVAGTYSDGASSINATHLSNLDRIFESLSKPRAPCWVSRNNNKALL
ncbi:hypothetical protein KXX57_002599 [Aspergillus fumigatus]|nr:hypothetical protein KXX57_002599 [Aspergillus fumigatus]KAH3136597.1 hypothetical protein KXW18_005697 [Aspergillus fumigatus]